MKKVIGLAAAAMLCVSLVALAGGDKGGKMGGTISTIDTTEKMMVVKDKDGKEWSIYWNDSTKVEGGELKEGEPVYFKASEKDGKMWASWLHAGKMEEAKHKDHKKY